MKTDLIALAAAAASVIVAAGCSRSQERVVVTGSSTVAPILQKAAELLEKQSGIRVDVQTGGSTRGIKDTHAGRNDIGTASRDLKAEEAAGLQVTAIGYDGIAIIVHRDNPLEGASTEEIKQLFTKRKPAWDDGTPTVIVNKAEGRSTLEGFLQHTKLKPEEIRADSVVGDNAQGVRLVAAEKAAIGYVSIGEAVRAIGDGVPIKMLKLDGVVPSMASVRDGSYPIRRTLTVMTRGVPAGQVAQVISFLTTPQGQKVVEELGFVPRVDSVPSA